MMLQISRAPKGRLTAGNLRSNGAAGWGSGPLGAATLPHEGGGGEVPHKLAQVAVTQLVPLKYVCKSVFLSGLMPRKSSVGVFPMASPEEVLWTPVGVTITG